MGKTDDILSEYMSIKERMMDVGKVKEETHDPHLNKDIELSDQAKEELAMTLARDDYEPTVKRYELAAFVKAMEKAHVDRPVNITVINRCKRGNEKWRDYTKGPDKTNASTCEFKLGNHRGNGDQYELEIRMAMFELGIKKRQDELTPDEWEKIADWRRHFHKFDIKSGPNCDEWEEVNDPWHRPRKSKK